MHQYFLKKSHLYTFSRDSFPDRKKYLLNYFHHQIHQLILPVVLFMVRNNYTTKIVWLTFLTMKSNGKFNQKLFSS